MVKYVSYIAIFCLFHSCTDNLKSKGKVQPTSTLIHYSLSDTISKKQLQVAEEETAADTVHAPKILHKALCRYTKLSKEFDFALAVDMDEERLGSTAYISIVSKKDGKRHTTGHF